jgi:hypothetical protein
MKPELEMQTVRRLNEIAHRLLAASNSASTLDTDELAREAGLAAGEISRVIDAIVDGWPSIRGPVKALANP